MCKESIFKFRNPETGSFDQLDSWVNISMDLFEEQMPRARAGHCSVGIHSRLYIWSGRDGYRKAWNNQVCCKTCGTWKLLPHQLLAEFQLVQKYEVPPPSPAASGLSPVPHQQPQQTQLPLTQQQHSSPPATGGTTVTSTTSLSAPTTPVKASVSQKLHTPPPPPLPATTTTSSPLVTTALGPKGTANIVRVKAPTQGQIRVVTPGGQASQILRAPTPATNINAPSTTTSSNMTGIAALAAAAAATQKLTTVSAGGQSSLKVLPSTSIVSPQTVKVANTVSGQTVRLISPTGQGGGAGGKQFILQKSNLPGGQPQIVTLVKTSKGLAPIPKVNLVQSKPGIGTTGPTIVKLVNTQTAGIKSGTTTIASSTNSQTGGQLLSLPAGATSIVGTQQGQTKTLVPGQNIVIAKQQVGKIFTCPVGDMRRTVWPETVLATLTEKKIYQPLGPRAVVTSGEEVVVVAGRGGGGGVWSFWETDALTGVVGADSDVVDVTVVPPVAGGELCCC
ncbi:hypothetical protein Avbf_05608 [Armadillidium vulgare]|nr:hypothetical protein Avbf_05608 [Armadillidium vulgare]